MSSKHLRRVLNEKANEIGSGSSDDELSRPPVKTLPKLNKFALLNENEPMESSSSRNDVSSSDNEKVQNPQKIVEKINVDGDAKKRRPKKKKKTKKSIEDLGKLNELTENILKLEPQSSDSTQSITELLKIDPRSLNPDAELRRLLGKTFRGSDTAQQQAPNNNLRGVHRMAAGKMVKVGAQWPPIRQLGIYMSVDKIDPNNTTKWYRFQHNESYQLLQQHFWLYQKQMDHESIMNSILVKNPYHLDSLLLLSEIMRVQEDVQNAKDAIGMGLYACENAFHSSFQLFSYEHRLSYEWRENRAFFLLLHWQIFQLGQRRCFATALQFAKILFAKEPIADPLAVLLLIDSISLKAKHYKFLIAFYNQFEKEKNLDMMPNFLYSMALAHFCSTQNGPSGGPNNSSSTSKGSKTTEDDDDVEVNLIMAKEWLEKALTRFPFVLGQILDKLQIQPDSQFNKCYALSSLAYHRETDGSKLICDIYLHHSIELWKQPHVLSWLEHTTIKILPALTGTLKSTVNEWTEKRKRCFVGMPQNIQRHSILYAIRNDVVSDSNSSSVDPCPPPKTRSDYEPTDFQDIFRIHRSNEEDESTQQTNVLGEFVRSLVPDEYQPQLNEQLDSLRNYAGNIYERLLGQLTIPANSNSPQTNAEENATTNSEVEKSDIPDDNPDEKPSSDSNQQQQSSSSRPPENE